MFSFSGYFFVFILFINNFSDTIPELDFLNDQHIGTDILYCAHTK